MTAFSRIVPILIVSVLGGALATALAAPAQADIRGWEKNALGLPAAHAVSQGEGVTVAVLDTGVEDSHPALKGKVIQGPDFVGFGAKRGGQHWGHHGTAMADSVLRVAPKARVLSLRAILETEDPGFKNWEKLIEEQGKKNQQRGGDAGLSPIAKAIRYAADHGADVISMSLGDDDVLSNHADDAEAEAITYAIGKGIPVLAGAGNGGRTDQRSNIDANGASWPAGYPGVIAVAAHGPNGERAPFSTVHTYNQISSPGRGIWEAQVNGGYDYGNGTSQATAVASGVSALVKGRNPKLAPDQVRAILTGTATHPPGGWDPMFGFGRINAARAVQAAANPPKAFNAAPKYRGKKTLGTPDGTPKQLAAEKHTTDIVAFAIGLGLGAVMLTGGLLLLRRRKPRAVPAGGAPFGGPVPPPYGPGGPGGPPPGGPPPHGPGGSPYGGPPAGRPPTL
ncbi:S8 family serine peptidase [Actinomadura sp. B10D3]|uniref:S8 family peptidase n=1 Tax=Actinomadura sp. B10D3 TaxID=3153557 RepID=UPI00325D73C2